MTDNATKAPITQPIITVPGLGAVPVVAIRLPDGTIALRHPSELNKTAPLPKAPGGGA